VVAHEKGKESTPESGLKRRVLAYKRQTVSAEHEMVKGWLNGAQPSHDQIVYVVHGHIRVTCQGNTFDARTGDTFVVRGGGANMAHPPIENSRVVDVFTPCRETTSPEPSVGVVVFIFQGEQYSMRKAYLRLFVPLRFYSLVRLGERNGSKTSNWPSLTQLDGSERRRHRHSRCGNPEESRLTSSPAR